MTYIGLYRLNYRREAWKVRYGSKSILSGLQRQKILIHRLQNSQKGVKRVRGYLIYSFLTYSQLESYSAIVGKYGFSSFSSYCNVLWRKHGFSIEELRSTTFYNGRNIAKEGMEALDDKSRTFHNDLTTLQFVVR